MVYARTGIVRQLCLLLREHSTGKLFDETEEISRWIRWAARSGMVQ